MNAQHHKWPRLARIEVLAEYCGVSANTVKKDVEVNRLPPPGEQHRLSLQSYGRPRMTEELQELGLDVGHREKENGPIPADMCLKCLDGNKENTCPTNWKLISMAVNARLSGGRNRKRIGYDDAPDELKPTVLVLAELEHAAATAKQNGKVVT